MDRESSREKRAANRVLRALPMIVSMLVCAAFGYALGIFPVWFHALKLHETETLGRVVMISSARGA